MKKTPLLSDLLAQLWQNAYISRRRRSPTVELLESRCVLSGFGMPPMMEHHGDFGRGGDADRFEESRFKPDFGGGRGSPDLHPSPAGEFGPRPHGFPELAPDFADLPNGEQRDLYLPPSSVVVVVVTRLPPQPFGDSNSSPTSSEPLLSIRGTQTVFNSSAGLREPAGDGLSAGAASVNTLANGEAARFMAVVAAPSSATSETPSLRTGEDGSHREEKTVSKQQSKESPIGQRKASLGDGFIELTADEVPQRLKRKSTKAAVDPEPLAEVQPDLFTVAFHRNSVDSKANRLPMPQETADRVLATWPPSGPAWSPEVAGLVEILAADMVRQSHQPTTAERISGKARDAAGLEAKIELHQTLDLATDSRLDSLASMGQGPQVSLTPRQPSREEQAE